MIYLTKLHMKSVLFVCTGNICRSPTADGLLRECIARDSLPLRSDSCGTHGYHIGEPPDSRSIDVAKQYGVNMGLLRARKLDQHDFKAFDFLIAMDMGHKREMLSLCPDVYKDKVSLLLDYTLDYKGMDVPDPYYGDEDGFVECFRLVEQGVKGFLMGEGFAK